MILTCSTYLPLYLSIYYTLYYITIFHLCTLVQRLGIFSALIIISLVMSILPKYAILWSVLSSNLVTCDISVYIPSYLPKYSSFNLSPSNSVLLLDLCLFSNCYTIFYVVCNLMVSQSN